ncbi:MAG: secretin and TonB N-terminal domain-containing protein [Planctomycetes bacterium]|nr:secretin and TonB N-terminal domain-containing protein [Planctomycetota bacterium]
MQNSVEMKSSGLLDVRFRNVELVYALEMLSEQTQENMVLQNGVSGTVSSILRRVTFQEALDAILASNDLIYEQRGNIIFISKKPVAAVQTELVPLVTHVFHLTFISAGEAERFLQPLLAEGDSVTRYSDAEEGIKPDSQSAGGLSSAAGELLVVITSPERLESMKTLLAELDEKPRQVLIEATIMRATLSEQNALGIDFNMLGGVDLQVLGATSPAATDLTGLGNIPQSRLDNSSYTIRTDFNDLMPSGGFTFGIIKDHVAAFIRALEQVTDVTVLANPKLLALNKQRGEIIVGRRDGYLTTTVTETAAIQTVEFLETGTKLVFRPYIMGEDYVRLEIHPEDSNGGLTAANLPFQETTEATTNVLLRSGHTILIAGLFRERTQSTKSRVPLISNIPLIGRLFGIDQEQTTREEIIILLTVTILEDSDAEYEEFDQLLEDVERVRVGVRRGLMGTGRDKLAQAHYQWALEHLRSGSIDKAETDVRMALHINPRHLDAIHLRERMTRERFSYIEGSRMRAFVRQLIRREAGLNPETVYQRPDVTGILDKALMRAADPQDEGAPDE